MTVTGNSQVRLTSNVPVGDRTTLQFITDEESTGNNLKIVGDDGVDTNYAITALGNVDTLWLTGKGSMRMSSELLGKISNTLYVEGWQLFIESESSITAHVVLGASVSYHHANYDANTRNAALSLNANTTVSSLEVQDAVRIGFTSSVNLTVTGALSGTGSLELSSKNNTQGNLNLQNGGSIAGVLTLSNGSNLHLSGNNDLTVGGLAGNSSNSQVTASGNLVINNANDTTYSGTFTLNDNVTLTKKNTGVQRLTGTNVFNGTLDVKQGTLFLGGTITWGGNGQITLHKGAELRVNTYNDITEDLLQHVTIQEADSSLGITDNLANICFGAGNLDGVEFAQREGYRYRHYSNGVNDWSTYTNVQVLHNEFEAMVGELVLSGTNKFYRFGGTSRLTITDG